MSTIGKQLARLGKKKEMCREFSDMLKETNDRDKIIDMYFEGINYCLANDFPGREFIKKEFGDLLPHRGILLDKLISTSSEKKLVILGKSSGTISVSDYSVNEFFVAHDSKISLNASDHSYTIIDVYDLAQVDINVSGNAKVVVNKYGGVVNYTRSGFGGITIKNKFLKSQNNG